MGYLRRVRNDGYRRQTLPYLCSGILAVLGYSLLLDGTLGGHGSESRRQLSAALPGESCEDNHLSSFDRDNKGLAITLYIVAILYMFLGVSIHSAHRRVNRNGRCPL